MKRLTFKEMPGCAKHPGLYGETMSLRSEALGNFRQAFTHLGRISVAYNFNRWLGYEH
ncbi:MAG: hypothetical protein HYY96_02255 [Candidatus Tectomicrobia bacterium]|nr:hypothetical protein [Candidatus Tectomicrobia bacterium]